MSNPERCVIYVPSDGNACERVSSSRGYWIYDPDFKIDVSKFCDPENEQPDTSDPKQRRIDSDGRDVTDLPGLWNEDDEFLCG